ncbi:hypothetical protein [Paenibacillus sp. OAS669]|uniref:hypothetical protein n=1 Tax=Paenibacillus sp. OAS669 TaxID=2663821 RepID=UPI0017891AE6|nr:hypothetical protein [Paenibacillus sp. OAS669]MBE1445605.1 hypothetical protein [Paenibacillus sp. OAS669]
MILYQMAKRMEQRQQLKRNLLLSEGDREELLSQKDQVEAQLISQANVWNGEGSDEFLLQAMTPESGWTESNNSWV